MSRRTLFGTAMVASAASVALLVACSSDEPSPADDQAPNEEPSPVQDASVEAEADADSHDADLGPCDDCEYFPDTCTPDVLCPHSVVDSRYRIHAIRGRSPSDVWAVGARGTVLHFDGTSWKPSSVGTDETLQDVWLRKSADDKYSEVAFVTLDTLYGRGLSAPDSGPPTADGWAAQPKPEGPLLYELLASFGPMRIEAVWAPPEAEWAWCATMSMIGVLAPSLANGLWRMRVPPSTGALEIGEGLPQGICEHHPCGAATSVHGASADTLWAVGVKGAAMRITDAQGDTPTIETFDSQTWSTLFGVWAAKDDDVWAVGGAGVVRRYTGNGPRWDVVSGVPTTERLHGVWGSSSDDVWVVGERGVVLHWDGTSWSRVPIAGLGLRRPNLYSVWVPSPGHVWIGGDGVVLSLGGKP